MFFFIRCSRLCTEQIGDFINCHRVRFRIRFSGTYSRIDPRRLEVLGGS